ncbi:hypothetical protein H2200_012228 [Cladophialophora chaetospira]|uniref:Transcription factor domain-containing protein n=1 Tax=Cladophialophora chaetospira TaxID=386627 RepID=A0AA38WYF6_9EURO|nr:hypothetical protein H2200_012228 [Cladophialophora chaetospira]
MNDELVQAPTSADYYPKRQDSRVEMVRPETSFLEFFKQSLLYTSAYCADSKCCSFFDDDVIVEGHAAPAQDASALTLRYPLLLFAELQDLPPRATMHNLLKICQSEVVPSLPFLSSISAVVADQEKVPFHLRICKALAGAATSRDHETRKLADRLWQPCASLVTGTVAVDNSLGRVTDWLSAATLLITVGVMQSNLAWWRQTDCINGYLQTTLCRQGYPLKSPASANVQALEREVASLRCFYFIVDTLRSIHVQTPSTVDPTWSVKIGKSAQYDLKDLCEGLILEGRSLPSDIRADEHLLVLFVILSTINTLFSSLGPLTSASWTTRQKLSSRTDIITQLDLGPSVISINPFVPLSVDREFKQLSNNLDQALDSCKVALEGGGPGHRTATQTAYGTLLPLLNFSKLLLAAGPCVFTLPSLSGYTSEPHEFPTATGPRPLAPHVVGIHFDESTVRHAIKILEAVETLQDTSSGLSAASKKLHRLSPMWYPFALFYGALVMWAQMEVDAKQNHSQRLLLSPRRLLQNFHTELTRVGEDWECARNMSEVVARLLNTTTSDSVVAV